MRVSALLNDESKWCQHEEAVDRDGHPCPATSKYAVKWCLWGALLRCSTEYSIFAKKRRVIEVLNDPEFTSISYWNDNPERTFTEVTEVIRRAKI